jgi:hypothetical protein
MDARSPQFGKAGKKGLFLLPLRQAALGLFEPASPWWVRVRVINGLALVALAATFLLLVLWVSRPVAESPEPSSGRDGGTELEAFGDESGELGDSSVRFSSRKLFRQAKGESRRRPQRANVTLSELSRKLTLQGILGGDSPRAIILNGSTRQVLYLAQGEYVGEIQVVEIRKNSVLLSWKEETLELIL